jgi:hypothetical protein
MTIRLPAELDFLLRDVARQQHVDISLLRNEGGKWMLDSTQRQELMDAVSDEFARSGLRPDEEPNERGLALESLLDRLNVLS